MSAAGTSAASTLGAVQRRRRALSIPAPVLVATGIAALVAWGVSLTSVDVRHLGAYGLVPVLPVLWYVALAVLLHGAVVAIWGPRHEPWLMAGFIAAVVVVLYATAPAVADAPQYTWTYKHIGVTRLLEAQGAASPDVDIYNRWPGFFALAAGFSRLTGLDPLSIAGWAEPFFALVDTTLVAALALAVGRDRRVAGTAALCFATVNWVGQTYFAPQTLAFTLDLVVMTIVVRQFVVPHANRTPVVRLAGWVARRPQAPADVAPPLPWSRRRTLCVLLLLDGVIAATHQLTPYVLVLQLAVPTALGLIRPRWLFAAAAAVAVAYLLPNFAFVESHYGLLSGMNPLDNSKSATAGLPQHRPRLLTHVGPVLTLLLLAAAALSGARMVRAGHAARAALLFAIATCPFLLLFGQSYGGEASLRVVLFASPFLSVIVALGIAGAGHRVRIPLLGALLSAFTAMFVVATLGLAGTNMVPRDVVDAADYFYAHAPAGSLLMPAGSGAPLRSGARYAVMARPSGGDLVPSVRDQPAFAGRLPGPADMATLAHTIVRQSPHGFLFFSTPEERVADLVGPGSATALRAFEHAVATAPYFRLWHRTQNARIYVVVGGDPWKLPASEAAGRTYERDADGRLVLRINRSGNARDGAVYRTYTEDGVTRHDYAIDGGHVDVGAGHPAATGAGTPRRATAGSGTAG